MSINCYEIACQRAVSEIAEINAEMQRLAQRRELLKNLLEPLVRLVPEFAAAAISESVSEGLDRELSPVMVLVELPEASEAVVEAEEANGYAIDQDAVARMAYRFWNERGQAHGHHEEDWARAVDAVRYAAC